MKRAAAHLLPGVLIALQAGWLPAPPALAAPAEAETDRPAAPRPDKTLVLDRQGYLRTYVEYGLMPLDAEVLKAAGDELFGEAGVRRLERRVRRLLKGRGIDWEKTDWRSVAVYHFASTQAADDTDAAAMMPQVPPPAGWEKRDFDDPSWLRRRMGVRNPVTPHYGAARERYSVHRRALYARTYVHVPDPKAAGELTLTLTYRGGARVLVNGVEVARGHLPEGSAFGAAYPREAYVGKPEETPPKKAGGFIGDLRCAYEKAPRSKYGPQWHTAYGNLSWIDRAGWDRLRRLRDRVLGPVTIPARLLRAGGNVIAVELRTAPYHPMVVPGAGGPKASNWAAGGANANVMWDHLRLVDVELRCASGAVPPAHRRPEGVQVWVQDMHDRLFTPDFLPPGAPPGEVRIVAAANGNYSAQLAVGTAGEITGLKATAGALTADGASIPASALTVGYLRGHPIDGLVKLGWFRCLKLRGLAPMAHVALWRYADRDGDIYRGALDGITQEKYRQGRAYRAARDAARREFYDGFLYFDHISATPPARVPAGSCQPLWLSLKVPAGAAPGAYAGAVTVSADGVEPVRVPVRVEVVGWRVPGPREFQTVVESEQSPYGVSRGFPVEVVRPGGKDKDGKPLPPTRKLVPTPLWSERHWKLMDTSFAQLARLGNDWVFVPVLLNSELGNRGDSPIRWVRRADGSLGFDYAVMDRYLDLAVRHLGTPRVISFLVMHGCASRTNAVKVFDEATGRPEVVELGPEASVDRRAYWRAFATSLREHMAGRGLAGSMHWGHAFDRVYDPELIKILKEYCPNVYWSAGAHARAPDPTFRAVARSYGLDLTPRSMKGWKNPYVHLLMPRTGGSVICVEGTSTPFTWRVMCDRAIWVGMNGLGRMGADYFERTWMDGFSGGEWLLVGRCAVQTLWPGDGRVETSARNEAMLEGIQEAEARTFMEQVLDRAAGASGADRAALAEADRVLNDHFRGTLHIAAGGVDYATMDDHVGWQERSRRLYSAAAKVAGEVGLDVNPVRIGGRTVTLRTRGRERTGFAREGVDVPAMGRRAVAVTLRNWTARPRAWKADSSVAWVRPSKASGEVVGHEPLQVVLDAADLTAGATVTGTLTVTDVASGAAYPVRITASVSEPFDFRLGTGVFNAPAGGTDVRKVLLVNRTASKQDWRLSSSAAWVTADPSAGSLGPGASVLVKVAAAGQADKAGRHPGKLTLSGGKYARAYDVTTYFIPAYRRPPEPTGEFVYLNEVKAKGFRTYGFVAGQDRRKGVRPEWWAHPHHHCSNIPFGRNYNIKGIPREKWPAMPYKMGPKTFNRGLWVYPLHESAYALEGTGFGAFAAEVGFYNDLTEKAMANRAAVVSFEVYVDGRLAAQSGLMSPGDGPRLLVVTGLEKAEEIRLRTRRDNMTNDGRCLATWGDPRFYKK